MDEEIEKKNIINEQRQSSFEKYLIDASETRKLEREMMEKREERREQRDRESQEQNRLFMMMMMQMMNPSFRSGNTVPT